MYPNISESWDSTGHCHPQKQPERVIPELVDARRRTASAIWEAIPDDHEWAHVVRLLAAERALTDDLLNPEPPP